MLLDLSALRTLVVAVDLQGFGKAARQLHRTPGAISLQLRGLEERVGKPLFRKTGRTQALTEEGELLVGYARRLLALNDEAVLAVAASGLRGAVRFGMTQDFAESWLTEALGRFGRAHASLRLDLRVDRSERLASAVSPTAGPRAGLPRTAGARRPAVGDDARELVRPSVVGTRAGRASAVAGPRSAVHLSRGCHRITG